MARLPDTPPGFTDGETLTAARMNTLSAFIDALAGRSGVVELEDSVAASVVLPGGVAPAPGVNGRLRWNTPDIGVDNDGQWTAPLTSREITAAELIRKGDVGRSAAQVAPGDHRHPAVVTQQANARSGGISRWNTGLVEGRQTLTLPGGLGYLDVLALAPSTGGVAHIAGQQWRIFPHAPARNGWPFTNPGAIVIDTPTPLRWTYYLLV